MTAVAVIAAVMIVAGIACLRLGCSQYGTLRLAEVLGALWILAAGPRERAQLRAILAHRGRVAEAAFSRPSLPERRQCDCCHETWAGSR